MTILEANLEAMKADAKLCNEAAGLRPVRRPPVSSTPQLGYIPFVAKNPGATARMAADHFDVSVAIASMALKRLFDKGELRRRKAHRKGPIKAGKFKYYPKVEQ